MRIVSPLLGTVVSVRVAVGDIVAKGAELCLIESMKMEYPVCAEGDLVITKVSVASGDKVNEGAELFEARDSDAAPLRPRMTTSSSDDSRLDQLRDRQAKLTDAARPAAAAKRHDRGMRTVRENIADLFDDGSFVEYGGFAVAAQRRRRSVEDLVDNTPADGLVTGIGLVEGRRCAVLAYDYTVLA